MREIKQQLQQHICLKPHLLQSTAILRMNALELSEYLAKAYEENPILSQDSRSADSNIESPTQISAVFKTDAVPSGYKADDLPTDIQDPNDAFASLRLFLSDQLDRRHLPQNLDHICRYMAELINDDGYLEAEDIQFLRRNGVSENLICPAVSILQSLDPPGIATRNLQECLLLQILRDPSADPLASAVVSRYFSELGKKQYSLIAKNLRVKLSQVKKAEAYIQTLSPRPAAPFQKKESSAYIVPDIFIRESDGILHAVINDHYLPRLTINAQYVAALSNVEDEEARAFLQEKLISAKQLIDNLTRRKETLELCADLVLTVQRGFFEKHSALLPLTMVNAAKQLGVHPSTVSRCVRGKYLQCKYGVYPLLFFFPQSFGHSGSVSSQAVKSKLLRLIQTEDPASPLSDLELSTYMSSSGYPIARRTVVKYRNELGIPRSGLRKRKK